MEIWEKSYPWEIKLKSGNNFTTTEYKTKREAIKSLPSRIASIQRHGRTYYVTAMDTK